MSGGFYDLFTSADQPLEAHHLLTLVQRHHQLHLEDEDPMIAALVDILGFVSQQQATVAVFDEHTCFNAALDVILNRYWMFHENEPMVPADCEMVLKALENDILHRTIKHHYELALLLTGTKQLARNTMPKYLNQAFIGYVDYHGDLSNPFEYLLALGIEADTVAQLEENPKPTFIRDYMIQLYLFYLLTAGTMIWQRRKHEKTNSIEAAMPTGLGLQNSNTNSMLNNDQDAIRALQRQMIIMNEQMNALLNKVNSRNLEVLPTSDAIASNISGKSNISQRSAINMPSYAAPAPPSQGLRSAYSNKKATESLLDSDSDDDDFGERDLFRKTQMAGLNSMLGHTQPASNGKNPTHTHNAYNHPMENDSESLEPLVRQAARIKLSALVESNHYFSIDDINSLMKTYDAFIMIDVKDIMIKAEIPKKSSNYFHRKISSELFMPGSDRTLVLMTHKSLTVQAPMVTPEQAMAFLQEQMLKCFVQDPNFPCLFNPMEAMTKISTFQQHVTALIIRVFGSTDNAAIQANNYHVTNWAVIRMYIYARWNRAMLTRNLDALSINFDHDFNQYFALRLGLNAHGTPVMELEDALSFLLYSCNSCGSPGVVTENCKNSKCNTKSNSSSTAVKPSAVSPSSTSTATHTANYTAALTVWRKNLPKEATKNDRRDALFRQSTAYQALSVADKVFTLAANVPTASLTTVKSSALCHNQARILLHRLPLLSQY